MTPPLVTIIHTTPASMAPPADALRAAMPKVRMWSLSVVSPPRYAAQAIARRLGVS